MKTHKVSTIACACILAAVVGLAGCSPCAKAQKLRNKAERAPMSEKQGLQSQASQYEAACLKKRDAKYDSGMNKELERMEKEAND